MPSGSHLTIQAVAQRTGLSPHVIRVWERRYEAIRPQRTASRQRRYSEAEVRRLNLLRKATRAGHPIGSIAHLSQRELEHLSESLPPTDAGSPAATLEEPAAGFRAELLDAVRKLDGPGLDHGFRRAVTVLGHLGFLRRTVAPLAEEIGTLWRNGQITAAHEHFFTASVKSFLGDLGRQFAPTAAAPMLIATTPAGQLHELGAFMAAVSAAHLGWRAVYLGPSLPAAEIAGAAAQHAAAAVALSLVYPQDDATLPAELRQLRLLLPSETRIIVGGRAASSYLPVIKEIGATIVRSLEEFSDEIDRLRIRASLATPRFASR
jgi:MerR family transcriptional regulator, light-induced transcriptional regulator